MFSMFDELKMAMAILKQKMAILDRKKKRLDRFQESYNEKSFKKTLISCSNKRNLHLRNLFSRKNKSKL